MRCSPRFSELGLSFQELLDGWLKLRNDRQRAINLLLLPEYATYLYADDKLMTAFLAVEAYHAAAIGGTAEPPDVHERRVAAVVAGAPDEYREWAARILQDKNSKGPQRKLNEIVERAGPTGQRLLDVVPSFTKLAHRSRNRVAHPSRYDEHDGVRYLAASMGLRWLLRHCLLADLGIPAQRVADIVARHPFEHDLLLLRQWATHLT